MTRSHSIGFLLSAAAAALLAQPAAAQAPNNRPPPPPNAKAGAPIDLTGQWVSVVTEDWRWRMITPPKGDYTSVPLNPAGRTAADAWDLAADNAANNQCKAFGVGGLLRLPVRIRFSWQDDDTLKLESDAGQQVRTFKFVATAPGSQSPLLMVPDPAPAERTWQGQTKAQWFKQQQARGLGFGGQQAPGGALRAVTRNMKAGYLRKNGAPYSENAIVTEQFDMFKHASGDVWLTVTTIVTDPRNLTMPFVTSSQFKKETDQSKWAPTPCRTEPPLEPPVERRRAER